MKVFLTGATGFIGSQLVKRLLKSGHNLSVVVRHGSNHHALESVHPQLKVYECNTSYSSLTSALTAAQPDLVIHLASLFLANHSPDDVARLVESNLKFPLQLLEAMSQLGIRRLINTGTSWQHYRNRTYDPVNLYAATKQAFESLLTYYVEAHGFRVITLKLFDTYGPGDKRPKLFNLLRTAARTGEILRMSPGEQLLDLVYIDDVLDAYQLAIDRVPNVSGAECYGISGSTRVKLQELVRLYAETVARPINTEWGGLPYRPREVFMPWTDYECLPGWRARVALVDGIVQMEQDGEIGGLLAGTQS